MGIVVVVGGDEGMNKNQGDFEQKRRSRRIPVKMELEVSSLFKQNNVHVNNIDAPIEIIDISKYGIGFVSKSILPIGYYFNANLRYKDDGINCVVKIIRRKEREDGLTTYGCEFVGMPSLMDYIFEDIEKEYEMRIEQNTEQSKED